MPIFDALALLSRYGGLSQAGSVGRALHAAAGESPSVGQLVGEQAMEDGNIMPESDRDTLQEHQPMGFVFQAWPGCCPKCTALDGSPVADLIDAAMVSHPNCKCRVVPAEDYTPFGSSPT